MHSSAVEYLTSIYETLGYILTMANSVYMYSIAPTLILFLGKIASILNVFLCFFISSLNNALPQLFILY